MERKFILCIDDEPTVVQSLKRELKSALEGEYFIETSENGEDALELLKELLDEGMEVPLVISDYLMPIIKGDELLKSINMISPNTLKIMLTGHASLEAVAGVVNEAGLYRYIAKPWDKEDLIVTVKEALQKYQNEKKIKEQHDQLERQNEMLQKHLKERERINEELELRVEERTVELQQSLQNLMNTQEQLIQSEKMAALGQLVAGIAHEVNTPLGICLTGVSHLLDQIKKLEKLYKNSSMTQNDFERFLGSSERTEDVILRNLTHAVDLVQSFKQVAVDQSNYVKERFEIKKYLQLIMRSLEPKFKNIDADIVINCDDDLFLYGYPGIFSQIVTNLVINSLIHGFDGRKSGQIVFDFSENSDNWLVFKYRDDGSGISEENLKKIFDPFFTTKRNKGGTGLGLHIIYNLITQKLGGVISSESTLGVGTSFLISFPLDIEES